MKLLHIGTKILPDWYKEIETIKESTGQSESEILREAIALYLKKSKAPIIKSRLDAIEEKLTKLAALIIK